jgi:hypothetical protein
MNYINKSTEGSVSIYINTRLSDVEAVSDSISWTMTKDGNDSSTVSFSTPSANFNMIAGGYYQQLDLDFFTEAISLENNTHYVLEGISESKVIYNGKVFVTDRTEVAYSVNKDKYTEKNSDNNFLIIN